MSATLRALRLHLVVDIKVFRSYKWLQYVLKTSPARGSKPRRSGWRGRSSCGGDGAPPPSRRGRRSASSIRRRAGRKAPAHGRFRASSGTGSAAAPFSGSFIGSALPTCRRLAAGAADAATRKPPEPRKQEPRKPPEQRAPAPASGRLHFVRSGRTGARAGLGRRRQSLRRRPGHRCRHSPRAAPLVARADRRHVPVAGR